MKAAIVTNITSGLMTLMTVNWVLLIWSQGFHSSYGPVNGGMSFKIKMNRYCERMEPA
jgi:hypothetical protein